MMHKTLIAAATAGLMAVGSIAATPAAAASSPAYSFSVSGPNFGFSFTNRVAPRPYLVCTPTFKRVTYWYRGHRYSQLVQTGQSCHWVYPSPHRGPYRPY